MPEIQMVTIQIRHARTEQGDPCAVEIGYYFVSGRDLTMTDENGTPMAKPRRLGPDDDPRVIAGRLTRDRWLKTSGGADFNRRIHSGPLGLA